MCDIRCTRTAALLAAAAGLLDARANFAVLGYPAYLTASPEHTVLDPTLTPDADTPPTFLIQAENDVSYGSNSR